MMSHVAFDDNSLSINSLVTFRSSVAKSPVVETQQAFEAEFTKRQRQEEFQEQA